MTTENLMLALLAMDAYNRGYGAEIDLPSSASDAIGAATVIADSTAKLGLGQTKDAGFYAVAYDWNVKTVISYRGTDSVGNDPAVVGGSDVLNGWTAGVGSLSYLATQKTLAEEFYKAVYKGATGQDLASVFDGANPNIILTGHSLGGGQAPANDDRPAAKRTAA